MDQGEDKEDGADILKCAREMPSTAVFAGKERETSRQLPEALRVSLASTLCFTTFILIYIFGNSKLKRHKQHIRQGNMLAWQ